jgi:hypothetical protein
VHDVKKPRRCRGTGTFRLCAATLIMLATHSDVFVPRIADAVVVPIAVFLLRMSRIARMSHRVFICDIRDIRGQKLFQLAPTEALSLPGNGEACRSRNTSRFVPANFRKTVAVYDCMSYTGVCGVHNGRKAVRLRCADSGRLQ